jgi:hypothetical protein
LTNTKGYGEKRRLEWIVASGLDLELLDDVRPLRGSLLPERPTLRTARPESPRALGDLAAELVKEYPAGCVHPAPPSSRRLGTRVVECDAALLGNLNRPADLEGTT